MRATLPGLAAAAVAAAVAWAVHAAVPEIPLLTASVVLGILAGQLRALRPALDGVLSTGLSLASKRLMRIGIVLLGLKLSLGDIAELGWLSIALVVLIVLITFGLTWLLGRLLRLPGHEPLLVAAGFSICGASAIGAVASVTRSKPAEQATPVALVTLFGTLAIAVLPVLQHRLGLGSEQFGAWVGASVHDVGQVVATAQTAGSAALAVAIVVKLTRVLMLAPLTAAVSLAVRRRGGGGALPPIVPLFVAGFITAVLVRSWLPVPELMLLGADLLQTVLLAMALFALGAAIRFEKLARSGWRAAVVGLASWVAIAGMALVAVQTAGA
ncbi:putative sulfate exporter family transporter [Salinibacterium sp. ZJ454]|uniref:YeiH family protein n=1 Tax=Salinibacterium sp. ZJ454 TaxID=2708339 RepID=UPI00141E9427|nr:putative sulfate exporter family transporter [Salinibacterium sp. ZJ454]